jgi:hypothetical protein
LLAFRELKQFVIHFTPKFCENQLKQNGHTYVKYAIRTAKSARRDSAVITTHFARYVFLTCGSSQNARAGTHSGTLARTDVMERVTAMHTH